MGMAVAAYLAVVAVAAAASAASPPPAGNATSVALREMQQARYFTFVMLLRMVQDRVPRNATFLVPNDRVLSAAQIPEHQVAEFLLRHTLPAPLAFQDLKRLPNGTALPTSKPDYTVTVTRRQDDQVYLNNVQIICPDICTEESIACQGINSVLKEASDKRKGSRSPACRRAPPPEARAPPPSSPPPAPAAAAQPTAAPALEPVTPSPAAPPIPQPPSPEPPSSAAPAASPAPEPAESPQDSSSSSLGLKGLHIFIATLLFLICSELF